MIWHFGNHHFDLAHRVLVMGILNVTPDSFSDGGRFATLESALARAREMTAEGAEMLDIGGESSRPGAEPVLVEEELRRVVPVIQAIRSESAIPISIDTTKAAVAEAALAAGADVINDISAGTTDPRIIAVAARSGAGLVMMHMQGAPQTMQTDPQYADVVTEVRDYLRERIEFAVASGVAREAIAIDPGIGFGKRMDHNSELLRRLDALTELSRPILIGVSRKSFLRRLLGMDGLPQSNFDRARLARASEAAALAAVFRGARIIRTHEPSNARSGLAAIL